MYIKAYAKSSESHMREFISSDNGEGVEERERVGGGVEERVGGGSKKLWVCVSFVYTKSADCQIFSEKCSHFLC